MAMTESPAPRRLRSFANLPLFWKLLIPYLVLILAVGAAGTFLIVRDLSAQAQTALDRDLSRRSLEAATVVHERELSVVESVNLAANLDGMATAARSGDAGAVLRLARSVVALKPDLGLLAVIDPSGRSLTTLSRPEEGGSPRTSDASSWTSASPVVEALHGASSAAGFISFSGRSMLAVAAPVCARAQPCAIAGVVLAAVDVGKVLAAASRVVASTSEEDAAEWGLVLYGARREQVGRMGVTTTGGPPSLAVGRFVRRAERAGGREVQTLYSPLLLQGQREGTLGVTLPSAPTLAPVRSAARRIVLVVLAAIAGVVAIGALLTRFLLARLRSILDTQRSLGAGHLDARVPASGADELGELARGLNQMADQLQVSHEGLEQRVRDRTAEVQRLLDDRTDLFTSISHEFRTPLAVILAKAETMQDPTYRRTPQWTTEVGSTIEQSARQVLAFVNEVLELAQAEAGALQVDVTDVDLPAFVRELRSTLAGLGTPAGVTGRARLPKERAPVRADPVRLREIVLNLVDNAVKYTPAEGRVDISASNGGGWTEVVVSDTGVGIPAEAADRIFEPFYRVPGSQPQRAQPSNGLGLALTRRLVEAHGGTIAFRPREGGGSTFVFTLPTTPVTDSEAPAVRAP
jgi:signal transduction histidine kinase